MIPGCNDWLPKKKLRHRTSHSCGSGTLPLTFAHAADGNRNPGRFPGHLPKHGSETSLTNLDMDAGVSGNVLSSLANSLPCCSPTSVRSIQFGKESEADDSESNVSTDKTLLGDVEEYLPSRKLLGRFMARMPEEGYPLSIESPYEIPELAFRTRASQRRGQSHRPKLLVMESIPEELDEEDVFYY